MTQPDIVESKTILHARKVEFKPKPAVSNDGKVFLYFFYFYIGIY